MFFLDALQEILHTIRQNKLRSLMTAFGVFWGIFMLILLLGAGRGIQNKLESGWTTNAQDSVWIFSNRTTLPYKGLSPNRWIRFTEEDLEVLRTQVPGILYASSENPLSSSWQGNVLVSYQDRSGSFGLYGVGEQYFDIKRYQDYRQGRTINYLDSRDSRKIATIGTMVAERLFPAGESAIGKVIKVNGVSFTVAGLFFDAEGDGRNSERIYISQEVFKKVYGTGNYLNLLTYQPKPGVDPWALEQQVLALLRERHGVSPEDRRAIRSNNLLERAQETQKLFVGINTFIWFVGIGTLAAGIVGISNIMIITVKERTREIGVRKALGARPAHIVAGLLLESVLITSVAGYLGMVMGVGLLELVSYLLATSGVELAYFQRPEVDFQIAFTAIGILVAVGALAGFIPAWHASKISPVEALRSE